jgi:hypothetical protein
LEKSFAFPVKLTERFGPEQIAAITLPSFHSMTKKIQCCGSGSVLDPDSSGQWIWILIWNPDPDPGGQK